MSKRRKHRHRNRHHLIPKSRKGNNSINNLLLIDIERHEYWHRLWANRTIDEVLELLTRVARAKRNQREAA